MQSETSSHQLKSYVASMSRLKLAARAVLSADAGLLVIALTVCTWPPLPRVTFFFQSHGKLVPWGHGTFKGTG